MSKHNTHLRKSDHHELTDDDAVPPIDDFDAVRRAFPVQNFRSDLWMGWGTPKDCRSVTWRGRPT